MSAAIINIALHLVGNKTNNENFVISKSIMMIDYEIKDLLLNYFLSSFTSLSFFYSP